ncbi:trafficking protein particle complex subunit 8, partial [Phenoliferia sp. Uapishka_3]
MSSPAAASISPHLAPLIHTFSTPDLLPILARSSFTSLSDLLSPFETSVERVTVRTSTYDPILIPRFTVRFVERQLPAAFAQATQGAAGTRARSATIGPGQTPNLAPDLVPTTPNTPFQPPTQGERDELFLDSLASLISQRVDGWIGETGREELAVRKVKKGKAKYSEEGFAAEVAEEFEEGWKGRPIERLTPWYAAMRDEIFRRREMVEWETFAWPVGCLLALSTSHPDPLNALSLLWDLTSPSSLFSSSSYPPRSGAEEDGRHDWASADVLRYIVLIHDFGAGGGRDGWEDAQELHESIRKTYGSHTALLPIFTAAKTAMKPLEKAKGVGALWSATTTPMPAPTLFRTTTNPINSSTTMGLGVSDGGVDPQIRTDEPPPPLAPTPAMVEKGEELSDEDLKALRVFLREMVVQSIVPFMERAVRVGNQQFVASKRSIGGRLFSAGRKYFGGSAVSSRSGSPVSATGSQMGFNAVKGYYPHVAQESQTRRLADLAFMIGDYKLAADVYDQASKDYRTDRAWRYYSSACRMAGLSNLLLHPPSTPLTFNPDIALEQALQTPPSFGFDLDGLKSMMLYYEAYRIIGDWRAAPVGLVRTAGESDEVASAILLEQAAIADLHLPLASRRKYAFHMAMAATRYEKSGIKSLSRRCLSQASSMYMIDPPPLDPRWSATISGWNAIRSHLHHGLGRQAYNVGKSEDAIEHFLELLAGAEGGGESGGEQSWLDDFGLAWEHLGDEAPRIVAERNLKLHATIFDAKYATVRIPQGSELIGKDNSPEEWSKLESEFLQHGFPGSAKKPPSLVKVGDGNQAVVGETFYLELRAQNPLDAPLAIGGLQIETDAEPGTVEIEAPQEIELGPRESVRVYIPIRATTLTSFSFTSLSFRFNDLLPSTETLLRRPKRLNATRGQLTSPTYATDSSLVVTVRSPIPRLSISFDDLPDTLLAGEGRSASIVVTNTGQVALRGLRGLCSHPSFAISRQHDQVDAYATTEDEVTSSIKISNQIPPNTPFIVPLTSPDDNSATSLASGASVVIPILCRADVQGIHNLCWLFVFQGDNDSEHLTSRAWHQLDVLPSLFIQPFVRPGTSRNSPYTILVEAKNLNVDAEVVITQISSVGSRWKCRQLDSLDTDAGFGSLHSSQGIDVFLSIEEAPTSTELPDDVAFSIHKLDNLLQGKEVKVSVPGDVTLHSGCVHPVSSKPHCCVDKSEQRKPQNSSKIDIIADSLFPSLLQTHAQLRHRSLTNQLPTLDSNLHRHLFSLFNSRSIDLLVFWTIPSTGASGHHHLSDIPLGAGTNHLKEVLETAELKAGGLYAESQRERSTLLAGLRKSELGVDENPIAVLVDVPELVEHAFDKDG